MTDISPQAIDAGIGVAADQVAIYMQKITGGCPLFGKAVIDELHFRVHMMYENLMREMVNQKKSTIINGSIN